VKQQSSEDKQQDNNNIFDNDSAPPLVDKNDWKSWLIYPESRFKVYYEIVGSIALLITCILTPFNLAFSDYLTDINWYMNFNYSIDIFFAIDIIINFNSAYMND
jgi:hypothetical protein